MNNIFKRTLSLLLVLVMCISMLPASALAEDTEEVPEAAENAEQQEEQVKTVTKEELAAEKEPVEETVTEEEPATNAEEEEQNAYVSNAEETSVLSNASNATVEYSGTCGDNLTWTLDSDGLLTISGTGEMTDYTYGNSPWESNRNSSSIRSVKIKSGVTSIGNWAFCHFGTLTVEIPASVTSIGEFAFYNCYNLTSVEIGTGVTSIGNEAFFACYSLTGINVSTSNSNYSSIDGVLFNKQKTTLICCPGGKSGAYTIPDGVTSIGDYAFADCKSITNVETEANVTSIGRYAFYDCTSLASVEIPDSVTSIGDSAFAYCSSLTDVYYASSEAQWNNIKIWSNNDCLTNAKIHYNSNDWKTVSAGVINKKFKYYSEIAGKTASYDFSYDDNWFYGSSKKYNHQLALMSMKMAMAAATTKSGNIEDLFNKLGYVYSSKSVSYPTPEYNSIGYAISGKNVVNSEGKEISIIAVAIRGGGYKSEWAGNFNVGNSYSDHTGWSIAANKVLSALSEYIETNQNNLQSNIKVWITGYSRGAATANMIAARLDDGEISSIKQENVYAYCFECPANTTSSNCHNSKYNNIFSIVNQIDFVPKVAMAEWDFGRYGITKTLPGRMISKSYKSLKDSMEQSYQKIIDNTGSDKKASDYTGEGLVQGFTLDSTANLLCKAFINRDTYSQVFQSSVMDTVAKKMGSTDSFNVEDILVDLLALPPLVAYLEVHWWEKSTVYNLAELYLLDWIDHAHYPELCLAWLESLDGEFGTTDGKIVYVNCPVNVTVYDNEGNYLGSIVDDVVSEDSEVSLYVDGNGQKILMLPADGEYKVVMEATDDGEVTYAAMEYDVDSGDVTKLESYYDIEIEEGDTLTGTVEEGTDADYPVYVNDSQESLVPDSTDTTEKTITVEATEGGNAYGGDTHYCGEYTMLSAVPDEGYSFLGWYIGDECVDTEREYRHRVEGDAVITAVFAETPSDMSINRDYIVLYKDGTALLEVENVDEQLKDRVLWSAENESESSLDIISVVDKGLVTAKSAGTAYVIASITVDGNTYTARCRVDVTDNAVKDELQGVQLGADKITSELYSRDYAGFDIILLLEQNMSGGFSLAYEGAVVNNGVAIESAEFADETLKQMFSLAVLDDRRLEIVPAQYAIDNPKLVKSSYSSPVTITVGGEKFTTEGSLKLTVKKTLPKLKAAAVTFNSFYGEQSAELNITGGTPVNISADTSKKTPLPAWLELDGLSIRTNEQIPAKNCSGTAYLLVETGEWAVPAQVSVSVKNAYKAAVLKPAKSSVTLNPALADSADVDIKVTPTDYVVEDPAITVYKGKNPAGDGELIAGYVDGRLHIETTDDTAYNSTYKVGLKSGNCKEVFVTVKTCKAGTKPTVTVKASGSIDLSYPGSEVKLTPAFKNYNSGVADISSCTVRVTKGKTVITEGEISDLFTCRYDGTDIYLSVKEGPEYSTAYTYAVSAVYSVSEDCSLTAAANLKLKQTAVSVKLEKSSVTLNPRIAEDVYLKVTPSLKDYTLSEADVVVKDKKGTETSGLTAEYVNGKLHISTNSETEYGTSYTVTVTPQAAAAKSSKLTVKTPAEKSSAVKPVLRITGAVDVIRDDSAVNVSVSSYKNYLGGQETENSIKVYTGKNFDEDVTELFSCTETDAGFTLKKAPGSGLDSSRKYKVCLEMAFANGETAKSDLTAVTVKTGTAKYKADNTALTLYGNDRYSQAEFTIEPVDITLNEAETVTIKDAKNSAVFELHDLGSGKYAIGFKDNAVDKSVSTGKKTVSVPLLITAQGNTSGKSNATVTVKVTVVN